MGIELAKIQADRQAEVKNIELKREVETKRAEMELERKRATDVVAATIRREAAQHEADAKFYTETKKADGLLYTQKQEAEAAYYRQTREAEVAFYARQKEAEAAFYAKQKEADALNEMAKAYTQIGNALGGPQGLLQWMMLQEKTYEKLAAANAAAIKGLEPKITIWNTGEGASSDSTAPIRNILQSLPPLFTTINEQTGISPPNWLVNMPNSSRGESRSQGKVNGPEKAY